MVSVFVYGKNELASDVLTRLAKSNTSINVLPVVEVDAFRPMPRSLVRLIGLIGAASLVAGAYGAHGKLLIIAATIYVHFRLSRISRIGKQVPAHVSNGCTLPATAFTSTSWNTICFLSSFGKYYSLIGNEF